MDDITIFIQQIEKLKNQKNYKKALEMLENSLSEKNDDYRIYEEIADIYLYEGKIAKAKKAIDFALNINSESPTGNYLKWFILLSEEQVLESIEFLEKSNALMPNNAEVLRNLGWAYSVIGEAKKWIFILKRALNISPNDKLITEDLAMAFIGMGKIKEGNMLLDQLGKQKVLS